MGNFVGFSDTQFVGTEELGAVSSYQPCHVFGDPMLIGLGIRLGFYLLYFAGLLAVLFGVDQQFRVFNTTWALLALSTLVVLLSAPTQTLIILDWAILIQLVLFFPVFFFLQVFHRAFYRVGSGDAGGRRMSLDEVLKRIALRRAAATQLDAARARAYADVLKAFALHAAAVRACGGGRGDEATETRLRQAIEVFSLHWGSGSSSGGNDNDGAAGSRHHHHHRETTASSSSLLDGGDITIAVYHQEMLAEVAEAPTVQDVEAFRDMYVAALVRARMSVAEARAIEAEVAALAAEELRIGRRPLPPREAARAALRGAAVKDKVAAAAALLVWSAWMFATPAILTLWKEHGRKSACDAWINLYFVFHPYNPWEKAFGTFLLIFASGAVVVGFLTTLVALWLLLAGLFGRLRRGGGRGGGRGRARRRGRRSGDEEVVVVEEDEREESSSGSRRVMERSSRFARCRHADEILASIHARETRGHRHRYQRRPAHPLHVDLFSILWAVVLLVLIVYTIAMVELTIVRDEVDFIRPSLHETAEILALLVGILNVVLVLWSVVEALFRLILSRGQDRHRLGRSHHHGRGSQEVLWSKKAEGQHDTGVQPEPYTRTELEYTRTEPGPYSRTEPESYTKAEPEPHTSGQPESYATGQPESYTRARPEP